MNSGWDESSFADFPSGIEHKFSSLRIDEDGLDDEGQKFVHDKGNYSSVNESSLEKVSLQIQKEAIVDVWQDCSPRFRVSVQILLESGVQAHELVNIRVSDCGNFLVVSKPLSRCIYSEDLAIIHPRIDQLPDKSDSAKESLKEFLSHHTRVIARKSTIKELEEKRGIPADKMDMKWEIKLPFKCRPEFVSEIEDKWFHGMNFYEFDNGEIWAFVELLKMSSEAYQVQNISRTLHEIEERREEEEEEVDDKEEDDDKEGEEEDQDVYDDGMEDDSSTITDIQTKYTRGVPKFVQTPFFSANADASYFTPGSFVSGIEGISPDYLKELPSSQTPSLDRKSRDCRTVVTRSGDNSAASKKSFVTAPNTISSSNKIKQYSAKSSISNKTRSATLEDLREVKLMLDKKMPPVIRKVIGPSSHDLMSISDHKTVSDHGSVKLLRNCQSSVVSTSLVTKVPNKKPQVKRKNSAGSRTSSNSSTSTSTIATNNTTAKKIVNSSTALIPIDGRSLSTASKKTRSSSKKKAKTL